jgi:MFS family permease
MGRIGGIEGAPLKELRLPRPNFHAVPPFRDRNSWYFGLSAYWFASSFKWFLLLLVILPSQVEKVVPGGEKSTYWGMVFWIGAIWAMVGPSLFGFLSDRLGLRGGKRGLFVGIGASVTVVALVFLSSAVELWQIVLGYLLLQFADDVGTGPYAALIPEVVPENRRGKASGVMGFLNLTGQLAVGITGLALVNVACALVTIAAIRGASPLAKTESRRRSLHPAEFLKGWIEPWGAADFRWVWFTRFLNALGFYLVVTYLKFYLGDVVESYSLFGLVKIEDPGMATNVLALTLSLVGAIGADVAGRRADVLGRKRTIYVSGVIMFCALVPAALIADFSAIWVLASIFAFGYGGYLSADWALVADVLPNAEDLGKDMGVWSMSITSVQLLTGMAGWAIDQINGVQFGWGYRSAFLIASIAFLLSAVLVRKIRGST